MSGIKNFFNKLFNKNKAAKTGSAKADSAGFAGGGAEKQNIGAAEFNAEASGNSPKMIEGGKVIILPEKTETALREEESFSETDTALQPFGGQNGGGDKNAVIKAEKEDYSEDTLPAVKDERKSDKPEKEKASAKKKGGKSKKTERNDIAELALLLNEDEGKVRDDCLFSGIKKFTEKLGKVIVRYDLSDEELLRLAINSQTLGLKETAVSPAYIPSVAKAVKRSKENMVVSALVDFPFGENAFSAKIAGVKESVSSGVDEVSVFMPAMSLYKENKKQLSKELKRIAAAYKKHAGVAFSAENLSEESILAAAKAAEKAGLNHVLFAFGESDEDSIKRKLSAVMKSGTALTLKVLGNVRTAEGAAKLFRMGAELVLTPYADEIGDELLKSFEIKSVKLI